ncbi:ComEC/Rec2 family competence protein [Acuticoccus sp. I52.16.1]|uniref:ComEC/Rec2 family competence protein n=1 Tax=Acuticoccus sp. I52.16.1 TaxID=2928472 RepID=UPI001FD555FB|nr:ComEC/Rec2 family competence protein [Acuticoccus sp. I52.16.1]UOM34804.1 ComEC family competence protein [Acuticoccus sp. I52.16.1]
MTLVLPRARPRLDLGARLAGWVAHDAAFGRFQLWLPVLAVVGIFLGVELPFAVAPWWSGGAAALVLGARVAAGRSTRLARAGPVLLALAAVLVGILAVGLQEHMSGTPVVERAGTVDLTGRVVAAEARGAGRASIVVAVTGGSFRGAVPRRVRLSVRGDGPFPVGARIAAKARLFPLQGPVYPGGYDSSRRLFFDGIGASGFTYGPPAVTAPPAPGLAATIDRVRTAVAENITSSLGETRGAAFATALLVGHRGDMAPEDVEALRVSGLGHLLAISGLHMALVAGSIFAAVRFALALSPRLALGAPIRKWAAIAGLLAATFYLALSGGSVATLRAYVMLIVGLVAILVDRPALTMRTIAVAAVVVIALDPVCVTEPSFQMSFLAVVALVGAYEWWSFRRLRFGVGWSRPVTAFVLGLAMTSLIAGLATAPAAAYHFHRLAPYGLPANLTAMPIFTLLVMPSGVIALALMPLGLEDAPLAVMRWGLDLILVISHAAADATGDSGLTGRIPAASAILAALGLLWLAIFTAPWRVAGALFVAAGLAIAPTAPRFDVMVAEDGETIAARGPDGRLGLLGDSDGFVASLWLKGDADPRADGAVPAACDPLGCTIPLGGERLARPSSARALADDCALAAAVVAPMRVRLDRCAAGLVIDRRDLKRHGAAVAWRHGAQWQIRTARPFGPTRRWQVPPDVAHD